MSANGDEFNQDFDSDDSHEAEQDGDESDPLASDKEDDTPPTRQSAALKSPERDDDEEDVFGPAIDQLVTEHRRRRKKRRKRISSGARASRTRGGQLPVHLVPVMGAANLAFISDEYDKAETLLKSIIEEIPRCPAPHRTLGLIYESRGDAQRALDHFMIAAEVERTDRDLWKRNAAIWKELGNIPKAILCLSNAIKANPSSDPEALRARAQLYMDQKRFLSAADSMVKLSRVNPFDVHNATQLAQCYIKSNHINRGVDALATIIANCEHQTSDPSNRGHDRASAIVSLMELLTELNLRQKRYTEANLLLIRLRGLCTSIGSCISFLQRLMVAICQHRLGSDVLAAPVFQEFTSSFGLMNRHRFLLWQVADACFDSGHYHRAANAYSALIDMKDEEPRVTLFLQRALCYKEINLRDQAKADLETVLNLKPKHVVAALLIQEFLPQQSARKRTKRSSSSRSAALSTRVSTKDREDAMLMLKSANELFNNSDYEGYLSLVYAALDSALELHAPWRSVSFARIPKGARCDPDEAACPPTTPGGECPVDSDTQKPTDERSSLSQKYRSPSRWRTSEPPAHERERLYRMGATLMRIVDQNMYVEIAERIVVSFQAVGQLELANPIARLFESLVHLRVSNDERLRRKLMHLELVTSIARGAVWRAYVQSRLMLVQESTDVDVLYTFTLVEQLAEVQAEVSNMRNISYRGLKRLLKKTPNSACLAMVMANVSSRGRYNVQRYTVGFYLAALRVCPDNALLCLCLAAQVLYVSMGRRIQNRNEAIPYALAFLQRYQRNRLKDAVPHDVLIAKRMETEYNVGRALHQLGIVDAACIFYERVLNHDLTHPESTSREGDVAMWGDLRREAAYNLLQIYRSSGAFELASKLCREYLTY